MQFLSPPKIVEVILFYKRGRGYKFGIYDNKSSKPSGQDLNSGPPDHNSSALTAQLRCLLSITHRLHIVLHPIQ